MTRRIVFRTSLCDLLGIDYPILQSGMGLIAGPDLSPKSPGPADSESWPDSCSPRTSFAR